MRKKAITQETIKLQITPLNLISEIIFANRADQWTKRTFSALIYFDPLWGGGGTRGPAARLVKQRLLLNILEINLFSWSLFKQTCYHKHMRTLNHLVVVQSRG